MMYSKYKKLLFRINLWTKLIFFILIVLLQILDIYRQHISSYTDEYEWLYKIILSIEKIIIAITTGLFGPFLGLLIGCLGKIIGSLFVVFSMPEYLGEFIAYYVFPVILMYGLYSILIGIFWKKYNLTDTKNRPRSESLQPANRVVR